MEGNREGKMRGRDGEEELTNGLGSWSTEVMKDVEEGGIRGGSVAASADLDHNSQIRRSNFDNKSLNFCEADFTKFRINSKREDFHIYNLKVVLFLEIDMIYV